MTTSSLGLQAPVQPIVQTQPRNWKLFWFGLANGLAWGAYVAAILSFALSAFVIYSPLGQGLDVIIMALLGMLFLSAGGLVVLLWRFIGFLVRKAGARLPALQRLLPLWDLIPHRLIEVVAGCTAVFVINYLPDEVLGVKLFPISNLLIVTGTVVGALIGLGRVSAISKTRRYALFGGAVLVGALVLGWLAWRGDDGYVVRTELSPMTATTRLTAADPGQTGAFKVNALTYGSGADRRPEFSALAELTTPTLDASKIHPGFSGMAATFQQWQFGFDFTQLPLNGRVWYPAEGNGPFPLALIVHGNHGAGDFSDAGYAYLGEHLASHGYIVVSVDENFLNGNWLGDLKGEEVPVRAWLLLQHLQQWREWNATPGNPFYGKVDLERIALLGHSRGGEAVAQAAEMNVRVRPPVSRVSSPEAFGFGIRAVIALAPGYGMYKPGGRPLQLKNVDYLLLYGGHDGDTATAYGLQQYNDTSFEEKPDGFKSFVYLYRANHGQFNTLWGERGDMNVVNSPLLNLQPYLSGAEQRQAARVFVTAFLEASLGRRAEYRALFRNPALGRDWLPADIYVSQYEDATFKPVSTNDVLGQPTGLNVAGGSASASGFSAWKKESLQLRDGQGSQGNTALRLAWEARVGPVYEINLREANVREWALSNADALTFALTAATDSTAPFSVGVELTTGDGVVVRLPLSQFGAIHPPLPAQHLKWPALARLLGFKQLQLAGPVEDVLQTYDLPLAAFSAANPQFDPARLEAIRFYFDGAQGGDVYLDQIGIRRSATD